MDNGVVGVGHLGQGLSRVSLLSAGGAAALFAQALGFRLGVAVGGRGLVAVAAVLGEEGFQFRDSPFELREAGLQPSAPWTSGKTPGRRGGQMERPIAHAIMLHEREEKYKC